MNKLYKLIDGDVNGAQIFLITEGMYKGVTLYYGTVKLVPPAEGWDDSNGEPDHIQFDFTVTGGPEELGWEDIEGSQEFQTLAGDILIDHMSQVFEKGNYSLKDPNDETTLKVDMNG